MRQRQQQEKQLGRKRAVCCQLWAPPAQTRLDVAASTRQKMFAFSIRKEPQLHACLGGGRGSGISTGEGHGR